MCRNSLTQVSVCLTLRDCLQQAEEPFHVLKLVSGTLLLEMSTSRLVTVSSWIIRYYVCESQWVYLQAVSC